VYADPHLASEEPNWSQYSKKSTTPDVSTFITIPDFIPQNQDMNYIDREKSKPLGLDAVNNNANVSVKFENAEEKRGETKLANNDCELEAAVRKTTMSKKRTKKEKPNRIMRTVCKRSGLIGPAHLLHPNKSRRFATAIFQLNFLI